MDELGRFLLIGMIVAGLGVFLTSLSPELEYVYTEEPIKKIWDCDDYGSCSVELEDGTFLRAQAPTWGVPAKYLLPRRNK